MDELKFYILYGIELGKTELWSSELPDRHLISHLDSYKINIGDVIYVKFTWRITIYNRFQSKS